MALCGFKEYLLSRTLTEKAQYTEEPSQVTWGKQAATLLVTSYTVKTDAVSTYFRGGGSCADTL